MRISQVGAPNVCLSFDVARPEPLEEPGFVAINIPLKIEDRGEEDGSMVAQARSRRGAPLRGKAIEKRPAAGWLLFRIPRERCSEGEAFAFCALVDEAVVWQKEYRVVWRGRFPGLEPAA
jgi:hypothetical protein